jgi:hypothetical protein
MLDLLPLGSFPLIQIPLVKGSFRNELNEILQKLINEFSTLLELVLFCYRRLPKRDNSLIENCAKNFKHKLEQNIASLKREN